MAAVPRQHPIRLVVAEPDDLRRSRLTVFFRLLLTIPHLVWLCLWGFAVSFVLFVLWLAALINGQVPSSLHNFVAGYVRYATHVSAYLFLAANPFPGFRGRPGYAVDVEIDPPARQSRWTALVRFFLALPAAFLAFQLGGSLAWVGTAGPYGFLLVFVAFFGLAGALALLLWLASLVLGRAPRGLRDLSAYAIGYGAQSAGYAFLLTGRYPTSDTEQATYAALPEHPVQLVVTDDLVRPRLTVLFRLLLAIPHFVWLALWTIAALLAALAAWFVALVTGRVPTALHRFLAAYLRYATHVFAFLYLVGRRFPGFVGRAGSYEIDLEIAPAERQNRWKTLFRSVLALPALLIASGLGNVAALVAFLAWWYALVTGRMPEGLRNLGASCMRYTAQFYAYVFLLTDRYPFASPVLEPPRAEPESALAPWGSSPYTATVVAAPAEEGRDGRDYAAISVLAALVLLGAGAGLLGLRSLGGPSEGVLRVLAPPGECWTISSGRHEHELAANTHAGCGVTAIPFDASGFEAQISVEPPTEEYDLGATVLVDGEVVRRVAPGFRAGLRVRYGDGDTRELELLPHGASMASVVNDLHPTHTR